MLGKLKHFDFDRPLPAGSWRKLAIGTWRHRGQNPQAAGAREIDVTSVLEYLEKRRMQGENAALMHVMAAAIGRVIRTFPEARSVLRFGKIYPRKDVSLLVQVAVSKAKLSGVVVTCPDRKSPTEIAKELGVFIPRLKSGKKAEYEKSLLYRGVGVMPSSFIGLVMDVLGTLFYTLNIHPRFFGLPADPYGCMRLNNLGALGMDDVIGPHVPWMHSPGTWLMSRVQDRLVLGSDGKYKTRKFLKLWIVFDHRIADGFLFPRVFGLIERLLKRPELLWGESLTQTDAPHPHSGPGTKSEQR
jgi:pyruvate dehydrogenase E2 component (dihydrolipoamide acetyltransferase)